MPASVAEQHPEKLSVIRETKVRTIQLKISGMSCTSCAAHVEQALETLPFVADANVSFAGARAIVEVRDDADHAHELSEAVAHAGYEVVDDTDSGEEEEHVRGERRRMILAWVFALPLMVKMLLAMVWGVGIASEVVSGAIDLALAFPVIFVFGWPVLQSTWRSFASFRFTMDALIGIGTLRMPQA